MSKKLFCLATTITFLFAGLALPAAAAHSTAKGLITSMEARNSFVMEAAESKLLVITDESTDFVLNGEKANFELLSAGQLAVVYCAPVMARSDCLASLVEIYAEPERKEIAFEQRTIVVSEYDVVVEPGKTEAKAAPDLDAPLPAVELPTNLGGFTGDELPVGGFEVKPGVLPMEFGDVGGDELPKDPAKPPGVRQPADA